MSIPTNTPLPRASAAQPHHCPRTGLPYGLVTHLVAPKATPTGKPGPKQAAARGPKADPKPGPQLLRTAPTHFSKADAPPQGDVLVGHGPPLGWKNLTRCFTLQRDVGQLRAGTTVFVKMGELEESCHATSWWYSMMKTLGQPSLAAELAYLRCDVEDWRACINMPGVPEKHTTMLDRRLVKLEGAPACLCLIVEWTAMTRMNDVDDKAPCLQTPRCGWSLVKNMLMNKYAGSGDFNCHNVMVDTATGSLMRVDVSQGTRARITGEGPASQTTTCVPYNQRGFQTSQRFGKKAALHAAGEYVRTNPRRVAKFIRKLKEHDAAMRGPGVECRWFDDAAAVDGLERESARAIAEFCDDIRRYDQKPTPASPDKKRKMADTPQTPAPSPKRTATPASPPTGDPTQKFIQKFARMLAVPEDKADAEEFVRDVLRLAAVPPNDHQLIFSFYHKVQNSPGLLDAMRTHYVQFVRGTDEAKATAVGAVANAIKDRKFGATSERKERRADLQEADLVNKWETPEVFAAKVQGMGLASQDLAAKQRMSYGDGDGDCASAMERALARGGL